MAPRSSTSRPPALPTLASRPPSHVLPPGAATGASHDPTPQYVEPITDQKDIIHIFKSLVRRLQPNSQLAATVPSGAFSVWSPYLPNFRGVPLAAGGVVGERRDFLMGRDDGVLRPAPPPPPWKDNFRSGRQPPPPANSVPKYPLHWAPMYRPNNAQQPPAPGLAAAMVNGASLAPVVQAAPFSYYDDSEQETSEEDDWEGGLE